MEKKKYVSLFGGRIQILSYQIRAVVAVISLCVIFFTVYLQIRRENRIDTEEQLISYLDEKYGVDSYEVEDFQIQKIEITERYDNKGDFDAYRAELKEDRSKEVCIWFYKENGMKKREVLCFDNFQQEEIEAELQKELISALGTEKGMAYLSAAEPEYMKNRYGQTEAVYNTLYEGDLQEFFDKEKAVRKDWMGNDSGDNFDMLGSLAQSRNITGRCAFWFPDKEVADIRQRLENPQCGYDEAFCQAVKNIEETYGIQVLAAAVPQSYYSSLEQALVNNEYMEKNYFTRSGLAIEEEAPEDIPFITTWYMSQEMDTTEFIEQQQSETEKMVEALQNGELQTEQEVAEECEELHSIEAQKLEEGIYLMDTRDDVETPIHGSVEHTEDKISITCSNLTSSCYMLILDMEKLGISEGAYYVTDQENEIDRYGEYPYTAIGEQYNAVWCGEGFLFIPCRNQSGAGGSSTYHIMLEAYPEE